MTALFSRRDLGRTAAVLGAGAVIPWRQVLARAGAASTPRDPLAVVHPELREAARQILAADKQMPPLSPATLGSIRMSMARYEKPMLPDVPVELRRIPASGSPAKRLVRSARTGDMTAERLDPGAQA